MAPPQEKMTCCTCRVLVLHLKRQMHSPALSSLVIFSALSLIETFKVQKGKCRLSWTPSDIGDQWQDKGSHLWLALPCVSSYAIWLATETCVTQGRNPCPFECYLFVLKWIENSFNSLCFPSASIWYMAVPDTQALSQRGYVGVISNISFLIGFRIMSTDVIFLYYLIMAKASSVIEVEICMTL